MRPTFVPRLINDPFSDPGLYIPFLFEKRALLFDLGDLHALSPRDLLKITHAFVTHMHMDHFIGFDTLLRYFLGRDKTLYLYGPTGIIKHVEGKLAGYTWNLVDGYQYNLVLQVNEIRSDHILTKAYACRNRFISETQPHRRPFSGIIMKEPHFYVQGVLLDHRTPCLGFSLVENFYVNIIKEGLKALDLPVGPWITRFKQALYEERDPESEFLVSWGQGQRIVRERRFRLSELTQQIARISPGQKITYVADVIGSDGNVKKFINLASDADEFFIEAAFLHHDIWTAQKKYHLTAKEAGELAKEAGAKNVHLFHFSPRYTGRAEDIKREAMEAFDTDPG
ncbi:MAG: ribonuclease Z [Deltaproteobacteria bacterium]|nr:ribonuclease Z [Deltaproteobacteria bacterium]